jgi:hypothetical protein
MMNEIFEQELQEGWLSIYLDDLLIGGNILEEVETRTLRVLDKLEKNDLLVKPEKCTFCKPEVEFLGVILKEGQMTMDPAKIKGIQEWPTPRTMKQV